MQGSDREEALTRMRLALESFVVEGVQTTMPFLARVMQHPQFRAGDIDTKWLEREFDRLRAELTQMAGTPAFGGPAVPAVDPRS